MDRLPRREFLRASGVSALAFLAACAKKEPEPAAVERSIDEILAGRGPNVQLIPAGTELIPDRPERFAFGVIDPQSNQPIPDGATRIWVAVDRKAEALGPFDAPYHGDGLGDRGVYVTQITFPKEGTYLALSETKVAGGETKLGVQTVSVGLRTAMPKVGDPAIRVETPTVRNARGVNPICTADPPCSLHEVSLADALGDKKPVVLIFATPAFCQSRLCGPEVEIVESIAKQRGDEAVFIHCEVYRDNKDTSIQQGLLAPATAAWKVVEEPAIYYIDRGGVVAERQLGPIDRTDVRSATDALLS